MSSAPRANSLRCSHPAPRPGAMPSSRALLLLALVAPSVGLAVKGADGLVPAPFPGVMPEWMHPSAGPDGKIPPAAPDYSDSPNPCHNEFTDKGCMPHCWSD